MPDQAVSNDTEIIAEALKTAEILMIFKAQTYEEQTVVYIKLKLCVSVCVCDTRPRLLSVRKRN